MWWGGVGGGRTFWNRGCVTRKGDFGPGVVARVFIQSGASLLIAAECLHMSFFGSGA